MKRSEINAIIRESIDFFRRENFHLPPFAWISPEEWKDKKAEHAEVVRCGLGWDVTDFGLGKFFEVGLLLVTLRNGSVDGAREGGKNYCEKIIHLRKNQTCPMHYHKSKTEDIINRSGATLCFKLAMADNNELSSEPFYVSRDGRKARCLPGAALELSPGESLTLPSYLYHSFWAKGGDVLVGEVSRVNDDVSDNFFFEPVPRFSEIEEDESPLYLLVNELLQHAI